MHDLDVLIAGAGPAGMATALSAIVQGLSVRIIDKHASGLAFSRAILVNSTTLALLEPLGAAQPILARALPIKSMAARTFAGEILSAQLHTGAGEFPMVRLPQLETEACLAEALAVKGVRVERPLEMIGFAQEANGVLAQLRRATGVIEEVRARYLVGADGFHSMVRQGLGLAYPVVDFARKIGSIDAILDWPYAQDVVVWLEEAGGILAIKLADRKVRFAGADLERLAHISGLPKIEQVLWQSDFDVHFAHVERYGLGRVWLAGDAAHVHSPIGGRGMNMGIADGVALGQALKSGQFEDYSRERVAIASAWVRTNRILTDIALSDGRWAAMRRRVLRGILRAASAIGGPNLGDTLFERLLGA